MRCQNMEMRSHQDVGEWWTRRSEKHRHGIASSASEETVQTGTESGTGSRTAAPPESVRHGCGDGRRELCGCVSVVLGRIQESDRAGAALTPRRFVDRWSMGERFGGKRKNE